MIDWAPDNEMLKKVELHPSGKPTIWDAGDPAPPSELPDEGGWKPDGDRTLPEASTKNLLFMFADDLQTSYPYHLKIYFDNGCVLER